VTSSPGGSPARPVKRPASKFRISAIRYGRMRHASVVLPSVTTFCGTLVSAVKKVANFVTSSACALAAKMMSLLCS
jgi:hypothetical protein